MLIKKHLIQFCFLIVLNYPSIAQPELTLSNPKSGLRLFVANKNFPLLKILLPGQPISDRGIEVEFPEHVTGLNKSTNNIEHLYLVTRGNSNRRTNPTWKVESNSLVYETVLNENIKMIARVRLNSNAVTYTYEFTNNSTITYQNLQAVTCVKLYSLFSDTLLERTYVHHSNGFDLLASETPERLTIPLRQWLPCRYLVSYTWSVPVARKEKGEDGITRYNKSRKTDQPFIATLSRDRKWVAATYSREIGNLWTNPERTCQHADPAVLLRPGETKILELKTYIFEGTLNKVLELVKILK